MIFLTPSDLTPFADLPEDKAYEMISDATSLALLAAPCLSDPSSLDATKQSAVKAVLRGAVLRWNDAGSGAFASQTAGPFGASYDTRQTRRGMFWPSEIEQLQAICRDTSSGGSAFTIDTVGTLEVHADICSLNFGALYCSCGSDLNNLAGPIYEV